MRIVNPSIQVLAYTQLPPTEPETVLDQAQMEALDRLIGPGWRVKLVPRDPCSEMSRVVERCGRISWKSEGLAQPGTADGFCTRVVHLKKDQSIAEHASVTMLGVMDRYASHQLVRHRIAAYTQESTHYVNYTRADKGGELTFCRPLDIPMDSPAFRRYVRSCWQSERDYFETVKEGHKHHQARFMVNGGLKTEIGFTFNLRIWLYVVALRATQGNTPEIELVFQLVKPELNRLCPEIFGAVDEAAVKRIQHLQRENDWAGLQAILEGEGQ